MRPGFAFACGATDGVARRGTFTTPSAVVETPAFMPVGTLGTVKGLSPAEVEATGARLILANTYHLWLRPGAERVAARGGVKRFMAWPHALLTDSGGFQVFSLASANRVDDDGVTFKSHLDGARLRLTPEESMRVQGLLGADVAMLFDECPPADAARDVIERAMRRTSAWAARCLATPGPAAQARFGIVQGGTHVDLRLAHLDDIAALDVDGVALGGLSVGEPIVEMYRVLSEVAPRMPADRPRYLMGVGTPADLVTAIGHGVDLFDCVLPTRNARSGQALTWSGRVNLRQARHKDDDTALDPTCGCPTCATFSRAYLNHLVRAKEMLGPRLLTQHNLHFYGELTRAARAAIEHGEYARWAAATLARMRERDEVGPADPSARSPRTAAHAGRESE
ncbi:MAG: tRNA guanosine(34) transglycosylase Tgt [Sandaracinaceae bacterium]|nr:tRNA guanosine(34) transglycosylase Tgt [Sandaracinaceae bacterium]